MTTKPILAIHSTEGKTCKAIQFHSNTKTNIVACIQSSSSNICHCHQTLTYKAVERYIAYHEARAIYGDGMDAPYIYCKGDIYGS